MIDINDILSRTSFLENVSLVLLVISISCLIGGIVLWFVLDIPHSIKVLTGFGAAKSINKLNEGAKQGRMRNTSSRLQASLNWNTSTRLDRQAKRDVLAEIESDYGCAETELLNPETELLVPETELLDMEPMAPETQVLEGFTIEEDIVITGTEEKLG